MKSADKNSKLKKPLRVIALLCCALLTLSAVSGAFYSVFGASGRYILTELDGFAGYNRIALATTYINGVKATAAFDGGAAAPDVANGVRVTGASSEYESFSVATCRAPDSSFDDPFAQGAHIDPTGSGSSFNAFIYFRF